ncbi:MAG TPA: flagellar hook-associated protein FlgK [Kofleriaceae bacterium]|jgi:flagellar hook-associated protein 1 FlgK|nr:flagellar hook-associated protein FlgK [Kofleriaceae bacterium]
MSTTNLLSLLDVGAAGMAAQNAGIAVASNNVANANTQGYSRETVDFDALNGTSLLGVTTGDPTRVASELLQSRMRSAAGSLSMSTQSSSALSDLEDSMTAGTTIDSSLASLFASISQANASPTDPSTREAVVTGVRNVVTSVHDEAAAVADAQSGANQRIEDSVTQASQLASELAAANKQVAQGGGATALDNRDQIASQLSALVGGTARVDSDGQMRFVLDGGAVLVDGSQAATLQTTPNATTGFADVEVVQGNSTRDVTSQIGGGSIGADLSFRDGTAQTAANQLDQLAYDISTSFNSVSTQNAALDGTTGHAMFDAPTQVAGAASALAIDPSLDTDSDNLALAGAGQASGDNTGGLALFALSNQTVASGGTQTLTDSSLSILDSVGGAVQNATDDVTRDTTVQSNLSTLDDSLSGVDTNDELTNLSKFQNTSQAMQKFVSTVNDMLTNLIENL